MKFEQKMPDIGKTVLVSMIRDGNKYVDLAKLVRCTQGRYTGKYTWLIRNTSIEVPVNTTDQWWCVDHLLREDIR